MTRIFQTQMWEAFVASKFQHNPPAGVLLFDESIIAKINRSTLKSVKASVSKNRRSTPFLDDISDEVGIQVKHQMCYSCLNFFLFF